MPEKPTFDLSPDWEFLAERLEEEGYPWMAERARNKKLSKAEVYGPVLDIVGGVRS